MHSRDQSKKQPTTFAQAKPFLAGALGALIGCGAMLHIDYTLLGGANQTAQIAQLAATVEHSRQVGEQTLMIGEQALALLKSEVLTRVKAEQARALMNPPTAESIERAIREVQAQDKLSAKPTQRELTDAIDGLFEKLPEKAESGDTVADSAGEQEKPSEPAGAKAVDAKGVVSASVEAAKK
ncbi:hypothetical protein NPS53_07960 [Pseudomonas putida]|uniref:hypothetical protein n=1 Tax=Pseudomonas putida TaxID=303 RepID=UPI0023638936|nr:hypothetical protein [Pseudomonas putida]MDD2139504.1 hypothetical protein [Pseudomonas putida]HDS1721832.1 hypothetical protein [Pseudomonas putida]